MACMVRLWYGYGMAMARLWHDNLNVSLPYGTIMRMSVLPDYVLFGEEARFPIFDDTPLELEASCYGTLVVARHKKQRNRYIGCAHKHDC